MEIKFKIQLNWSSVTLLTINILLDLYLPDVWAAWWRADTDRFTGTGGGGGGGGGAATTQDCSSWSDHIHSLQPSVLLWPAPLLLSVFMFDSLEISVLLSLA